METVFAVTGQQAEIVTFFEIHNTDRASLSPYCGRHNIVSVSGRFSRTTFAEIIGLARGLGDDADGRTSNRT
jgi:hypothetical protein